MDPISFTMLVFIAAFATAKVITNYKVDREYAKQGLDSPRMRMKMAKAQRGEASLAAVARTRPGAAGYFRELWGDAWDDAIQRHRKRRAAKKAGTAPPKRYRKPWWRYIFDPIGDPSPTGPPAVGQPSQTPPTSTSKPAQSPPRHPTATVPPARANSRPPTNRAEGGIPCPNRCDGYIDMRQFNPPNPVREHCTRCGWLTPDPDAPGLQHEPGECARTGCTDPTIPLSDFCRRHDKAETANQPDQGDDMTNSTATGDVHDVESCDAELNALTDDLTAIDTALDVIDENVRSARSSAELIQAFLAGKNVDGEVLAGLTTALDMLGPNAIKTLIDSIAAAKAGVEATKDAMGPLREASNLVGSADGSVLNGR